MKTILTRTSARSIAHRRAQAADLNPTQCDTVAHRVMTLFDPEYSTKQWIEFIDVEISQQVKPVVCAWCPGFVPDTSATVSHGICPTCAERLRQEDQ